MADLSDVEVALVNAVTAIAFPLGDTAASAFGAPARIFRGMPAGSLLTGDRGHGIIDISVFPLPNHTRNTTRWGPTTFDILNTPGISATAVGNSATFSGCALQGDLAGVLVNQSPYVYTAQAGDSAALVAAILANSIKVNTICWLSGTTITVPAAQSLVARTAAPATEIQEFSRQEQEFRISTWAPNPQLRDAACSLLGSGLAKQPFLTFADCTSGRLRYHSTASDDDDQASSIYRRDLIYSVEYGTTVAQPVPTVLFGDLSWNGQTILS